ncbi:hypothetical protein CWE22_09715 [Pseudidiomarina aestuarii]|uniref:Uncharacterized protein n=1 Tax=Pseudidiomarina aestuarii TaxID=624146 RepID=A0A7Z7ET03_9GAMM|nr:hypothetical protein [Pseudidiomarina aestuarii]RUO39564.1 hypothetical protein CWE22_09715 [Pseudidiomarina aestuarii]
MNRYLLISLHVIGIMCVALAGYQNWQASIASNSLAQSSTQVEVNIEPSIAAASSTSYREEYDQIKADIADLEAEIVNLRASGKRLKSEQTELPSHPLDDEWNQARDPVADFADDGPEDAALTQQVDDLFITHEMLRDYNFRNLECRQTSCRFFVDTDSTNMMSMVMRTHRALVETGLRSEQPYVHLVPNADGEFEMIVNWEN